MSATRECRCRSLQGSSTLREGTPTVGKGRAKRTEFQLHDTFVSMADGPVLEVKVRKM